MKHFRLYMQKYITWEITSITINTIVIWAFTGSFMLASGIVMASLIPRAIAYQIHERLYKERHNRLYLERKNR